MKGLFGLAGLDVVRAVEPFESDDKLTVVIREDSEGRYIEVADGYKWWPTTTTSVTIESAEDFKALLDKLAKAARDLGW